MLEAIAILSIPFTLVALVYLVVLGTVRLTKGGGAGIVWVGLGLFIQWRYWEINHAPYVPLLMPSPFIIVAFVFTAGGIWLFARTRSMGAWKWALLALVPVVGPLFAGLRLLLMPVIRPRRPSFGSVAFTVLPGLILYFCIQLQGLYHPRDQISSTVTRCLPVQTSLFL